MIWILLLVLPALAMLYVAYLIIKAIFILVVILIGWGEPVDKPTIGELDYESGKVKWQ